MIKKKLNQITNDLNNSANSNMHAIELYNCPSQCLSMFRVIDADFEINPNLFEARMYRFAAKDYDIGENKID